MNFILAGRAEAIFKFLRIAAFIEVMATWDEYEIDPEWWQIQLKLMCWN